jgi:hypothetical protein
MADHGPNPEGRWPEHWHLPATWVDLIILVVIECIAIPVCIAAGGAFVEGEYVRCSLGWLIGVPFVIIGFTAHWWKQRIADATRATPTPGSDERGTVSQPGWIVRPRWPRSTLVMPLLLLIAGGGYVGYNLWY